MLSISSGGIESGGLREGANENNVTGCYDSDGGKDYNKFGKVVEGGDAIVLDDCKDDKTVIENYCDGDVAKYVEYECPEVCSLGRCKSLYDDNETDDDNEMNRERYEYMDGEMNGETLRERIRNNETFELSNGINAYVKVMPEVASETALERLRLKVCNESNNCTIELKEVGYGNQTKLAYELKAQKESKVFFMFKKKMQVEAQVDAESGEVIREHKPWWAFLADE
jgi:hypothetical protein